MKALTEQMFEHLGREVEDETNRLNKIVDYAGSIVIAFAYGYFLFHYVIWVWRQ